MSLLLPLFSEFVRRVTNGGTVLYVGVEDGSLTEAALMPTLARVSSLVN